MQCWLRQIKTTLHMVIFLRKDDCVVWHNIASVILLCNVLSDVLGQNEYAMFLCNVVLV